MHVLKLVYFFLKHFSLIFLCNYHIHCAAINEFKFIVLFNISHLKMWSSFRKKLYTRLKVGRYPAKYMKSLTSFSYESLKYEIFFRPRVGKILVKTSVEIENRGIGWGLKVNKKKIKQIHPRVFRPFKIRIQIFDKPGIESGRETCCAKISFIRWTVWIKNSKLLTSIVRAEQCVDRRKRTFETFSIEKILEGGGFCVGWGSCTVIKGLKGQLGQDR